MVRKKLCYTCGHIYPEEKFPLKHTGRREAECADCLNKEPIVKQRPKILGKSPIPPRLGKLHPPREVMRSKPKTRKRKVKIERAIRVWEKRLHRFSTGRGWFTVKEAEGEIMYSTPVVREILNALVGEGFLEKKTECRRKMYRLKENPLDVQEMGVVTEV